MADQTVRGRFVWHELMTPDSAAAHAFYSKVLGWKSQPWEHDPSYVMFAAPRGPIGGAAVAEGAAHWLPYIGTGDIEATVKQAKERGGSVVKDVTTMPNGGKYAVLTDPQGVKFGVYESAQDYGKVTPPKAGEYSWHELSTSDYKAAFAFYSALFGWEKIAEHDMGELGFYFIYGLNGTQLGGFFNAPPGAPHAWLGYVRVKDVHQTAKKVKSAGGKVVNGPMEVPGGDWIVQGVDKQGAAFAAHTLAADLKKAAPAAAAAAPEAAAAAPAAEEPAAAEPAKKAAPKPKPAAKKPAAKAAAKSAAKPAKKAAKPAAKKPAQVAKKSAKKKAAKKPAAKSAAKAAKKSTKKGGKKVVTKKTRSGGKKKAAKKPRKGK